MKDIITFYTSDIRLHWRFMVPVAEYLIMNTDIIPVFLMPCADSLEYIGNLPYIDPNGTHGRFFDILKPFAHIQMQDHDKVHRDALVSAKKLGIVTFNIQHGTNRRLNGSFDYDNPVFNTAADFVFIWGDSYRKGYTARGISDEKLLTVGNPRYDYYPKDPDKIEIKKVLIAPRPPRSTDGPSDFVPYTDRILRSIVDMTNKFPDLEFYIKQHPSDFDDQKELVESIDERGKVADNLFIIPKTHDIIEVLNSTEFGILCHYGSTCSTDANGFGIPIIDLRSDFDICEEIQRLIDGEEARSFQYTDIPTDRNAAERIAEFIISIYEEANE